MSVAIGIASTALATVWAALSVIGVLVAVDEWRDDRSLGVLAVVLAMALTAACLAVQAWRCLV